MLKADKKRTNAGSKLGAEASLQLLPLIMQNIPQAVFWKDQNLVYLGCNRAFAEDAGFASPEEVIGKTDFDMPWKAQAELYRADDRRVLDSGEAKLNYEEPQTTPVGATTWLRTSKIPVCEDGRTVAILGMYEDITERKQAESLQQQSETVFKALFEMSPDAVTLIDPYDPGHEWPIVDCNTAACRINGYTREELIGQPINIVNAPTDTPIDRTEYLKRLHETGTVKYEVLHRRKDGTIFTVEVSTTLIKIGERELLLGIDRDITERKQVEETIEKERQRFQMILETIRVPTIISRLSDGIVLYANEAIAQVSRVDLNKLIGFKTGTFYANPDDRKNVLTALQQHQHINDFEVQFQRTDGSQYWALLSARIIDYEGDRCVLSTYIDITERKQAEQAIAESEERFKRFTEATFEGLVFHDVGKVIDANPAATTMFGFSTAEEAIGRNLLEFILPEYHEVVLKQMQLGTVAPYEIQCVRLDGTRFPVETSTRTYQVGERTLRATSLRDITERKQVERALRESQKFLQIVMDNIPQSIFWKDSNLTYLGCNSAFAADAGFASPNEIVGKTDWDMPWKGQAEAYRADDSLVIKNGIPKLNYEEPQTTPDGRTSWLRTSKIPLYDVDGNPFAVLGMYEDITERKQSEKLLQQSETNMLAALQVANMGHWEYDIVAQMFTVNDQYYSLHGMTAQETGGYQISLQRFAQEFVYPEDAPIVGQATQQAIETTDPNFHVQTEARILHADGKPRWVTVWFRVEKDAQGRTIKLHGVSQDITERKQLEEVLLLRNRALASSLSAVLVVGLDFKPIYVNESFLKMTGYTYEEAMRLTITDLSAYPEGLKRIDEATRTQGFFIGEETLKRKDGSIFPTDFSTSYIADATGKPIAIQTAFIDITERKSLEAQVREAFERRGLQVQLSTQVSQSIAAASSLPELYDRVVSQIKEQFGYYHTQLLRYDPAQEAVMLVVGYGDVGAQMLADGHRMPMGEGLIGTAAATGETILRSVLTNDPDWHPNPLLPETKGEIAVPIKIGDAILGVLDVQSNEAGSLDADDQLLLEGLCGQIATAIESTRLRQEMADRLEEINRLYRAMSHEGWQTYRQTANLPTSFLYDQAGLRPAQEADLTQELFSNVPLAIPGGEVIGTLSVADDARRPLTPDDETFLLQVSEQLALALESARLFEQTQSALSEVERRASELETVAQLSATTASVLDPDQLLQTVVELTKERFGLYHAHIYVYDESWNTLLLAAGAGEVGRKLVAEQHAIPLTVEQSLVTRAARERRAIIVNDVNTEPDFLPNPLLPETSAELAVPMVAGDKLLGVFDVQSNNPAGFTVEDANIYVTLATQVAVALQNARLYVEQAALVTQLRELDRLKSSFLANMSHELRTPLNSILGFADVIIEELDGPLTENMANDLRLIQKNGQHLLHLINDVLDMAKIEAGRMNLNPERFTACEVLEEVTSITSTLASEKNLALFITEDTDREVKIFADRTRLRQVMINLVNNAIKFTETGKISLKVAPLEGARILITVKDTGLGIPPDKLEAVFQEFTQVDSSSTRKAGGTGLGLPISRKLVEMHGGRLWAESSGIPGEGSTFFVELPVEARITETVEKQAK